MFKLIGKAIMRNKLQRQLEADLRLADLCWTRARELTTLYAWRQGEYSILDEVESLCRELEGRE